MGIVSFRAMGRMGNFLFEAASSFGYAKRNNLEWSVPNWSTHPFWSPVYLQHLVHPNYDRREDVLINENGMQYQEIPFKENWRNQNIVLNGYWQTEKYFSEYRDEIIELFNYPYKIKEDTCSIQARFGDYLTVPNKHILVDEPYLRSSMAYIKNETGIKKFKVFSDDLNYFRNNLGHIYDFEYSVNGEIEQDLIEISCCHSNINSSSTFSWWAAWLNRNPDKIIITQSKWFQDGWKEGSILADTKDIIPNSWIKL